MSELITMDGEYVTRDGRAVRVLCVDKSGDPWPVVALVAEADRDRLFTYLADGRYSRVSSSACDLIPKPKRHKRTVWLLHHRSDCTSVFTYRDKALSQYRRSPSSYIGLQCVEADFAEGEGLEP